jgi:hypothetical protein
VTSTDADLAIFWAVVAARFLLPLLIPRFPLPAVIGSLVLDAADKSIFELFTDLDLSGYQGYDKSLDIYYLTVAMLTTFRNWVSPAAVRTAQFLFYYRLVGVLVFELTQLRAMLLVFPNTFEYFFVFYEAVRSRWSPTRMSTRFLLVSAAVIWIFVKLPQEYWIHVAQLDVTDMLKTQVFGVEADSSWVEAVGNRPLALVLLVAVVAGLVLGARALVRAHAPSPDHPIMLAADPLPDYLRASERAEFVARNWRVIGVNLLEKIVLVSLVSSIFAQIIPSVDATPLQVTSGVAVVATVNSFLVLRSARRAAWRDSFAASFGLLAAVNVGLVLVADWLLERGEGDLDATTALFFLLLLTLLVTMYDRWRPLLDMRRAHARAEVSPG